MIGKSIRETDQIILVALAIDTENYYYGKNIFIYFKN